MYYIISSECIACGRCEKACPVGCIVPGDGQYEIPPAQCVGCGTCAGLCPISAIHPEGEKAT